MTINTVIKAGLEKFTLNSKIDILSLSAVLDAHASSNMYANTPPVLARGDVFPCNVTGHMPKYFRVVPTTMR